MVLTTAGLTKQFPIAAGLFRGRRDGDAPRLRTAVDNLSLSVEKGDIYGFLGPNGAGKSTTLRMIVGLIRPTKGEITILGERLTFWNRQPLRRVGAIVEAPAFYMYLSGWDNLRMLSELSGGAPQSRLEQVLERVGLSERAQDPVSIYSHGMKSRLAIAAALLPRPELVLLDEPTNGLDPVGIRDVRALIRSLAEQDGLTVFLASHLLSEVEQLCNRAAIVARGTKIYEGKVAELLSARRRVRVVATPVERARGILDQLAPGYVSADAADPARLYVAADRVSSADVVDALVHQQCRVSEVVVELPALEDVFIELVDERPAA